VKLACAAGAQVIVFDVDSPGGFLDPAFDITAFIGGPELKDVTTVAYVSKRAMSAAAFFCVACRQIVMREGATLGDCQPIIPVPDRGYIEGGEKIQSPLRAAFRGFAEAHGYPVALCEAIVTKELGVYEVTRPDGTKEYIAKPDYDSLSEEQKKSLGEKRLVVRPGELLTMTAKQAAEYGFARAIVADRDEAVRMYLKEGGKVLPVFEPTWSEQLVRFLNHPGVTSLLLMIGLVAGYFALKMPGVGVPEAVAALCFAIIFLSKHLVGLAGTEDILIFGAGVVLLAIEIFLLPGFGVTGVLGILGVLIGMILMMQRFTIPRFEYQVDILAGNLLIVLATLIGSVVIFFLLARFIPSTPWLNRLVLKTREESAAGYTVARGDAEALVGQEGVALSPLRPAGRAEIAGRVVDVVAEGEFLEPGVRVKVVAVEGNRVAVTRA